MRRREENVVRYRSVEGGRLGSWRVSVSRRSSVVAVVGNGMHSVLGRLRPEKVFIRTLIVGDAIFAGDDTSALFPPE
jgi:hypothetical protein